MGFGYHRNQLRQIVLPNQLLRTIANARCRQSSCDLSTMTVVAGGRPTYASILFYQPFGYPAPCRAAIFSSNVECLSSTGRPMEQGLEGGLVSTVYPSTFLRTSPQSMSDRAITDQEEATVQKQLSIRLIEAEELSAPESGSRRSHQSMNCAAGKPARRIALDIGRAEDQSAAALRSGPVLLPAP